MSLPRAAGNRARFTQTIKALCSKRSADRTTASARRNFLAAVEARHRREATLRMDRSREAERRAEREFQPAEAMIYER